MGNKSVAQPNRLCSLPDDLIAAVLGYMDARTVYRVVQSCRQLRRITADNTAVYSTIEARRGRDGPVTDRTITVVVNIHCCASWGVPCAKTADISHTCERCLSHQQTVLKSCPITRLGVRNYVRGLPCLLTDSLTHVQVPVGPAHLSLLAALPHLGRMDLTFVNTLGTVSDWEPLVFRHVTHMSLDTGILDNVYVIPGHCFPALQHLVSECRVAAILSDTALQSLSVHYNAKLPVIRLGSPICSTRTIILRDGAFRREGTDFDRFARLLHPHACRFDANTTFLRLFEQTTTWTCLVELDMRISIGWSDSTDLTRLGQLRRLCVSGQFYMHLKLPPSLHELTLGGARIAIGNDVMPAVRELVATDYFPSVIGQPRRLATRLEQVLPLFPRVELIAVHPDIIKVVSAFVARRGWKARITRAPGVIPQ